MIKKPFNNDYVQDVDGTRPILLEMPHSGFYGLSPSQNYVPSVIADKIRIKSEAVLSTVRAGCDVAVPLMCGFDKLIIKHDLPAIFNLLARTYCDTNREKNQVSDWAMEEGTPFNHHHGIIWARTMLSDIDLNLPQEQLETIVKNKCARMLSEPLSVSEFNTLIEKVYDPYHAGIRYHHKKSIARHGYCIHLALHSLPPLSVTKVLGGYVMGQTASRGPFNTVNNTLPDIILIHNNYKAANKYIVDQVRSAFESGGLIVEDGQGPFLGDIGITKMYGDPEKGINVIGIEHVTHDIEPNRHLGNIEMNVAQAKKMQKHYNQAIINLLAI